MACSGKLVKVQLNVHVRSDARAPISGAQVKIAGQLMGSTDHLGLLNIFAKLPLGETAIEVAKSDPRTYFEPFQQTVMLSASQRELTVEAVLFALPKPSFADAANSKTEPVASTPSIAGPEAKAIKEISEIIVGPSLTISDSHLTHDPPPPAVAMPTVTVQKSVLFEQKEVENNEVVFSVYVFSGKSPLPDADVYSQVGQDSALQHVCRTRPSGRCVIRYTKSQSIDRPFSVHKEGYISQVKSVSIVHKGSLRFDLMKGLSHQDTKSDPQQEVVGKTPFEKENVSRQIVGGGVLKSAGAAITAKDYKQAVALLSSISRDQSEFLMAQEQLGDLFLFSLRLPARAAEAYHQLRQHPDASHLSKVDLSKISLKEAIAMIETGERLIGNRHPLAREHFASAKLRLESIPGEGEAMFYLALCEQRLWQLTQQKKHLVAATKAWRLVLNKSSTGPTDTDNSSNLEKARLFLSQNEHNLPANESGYRR